MQVVAARNTNTGTMLPVKSGFMALGEASNAKFVDQVATLPTNSKSGISKLKPAPHDISSSDPFIQFEAMFIRNFVESMLPSEIGGSSSDNGGSGEYWKSLLADEMAKVMAKSARLGIADEMRARYRNLLDSGQP